MNLIHKIEYGDSKPYQNHYDSSYDRARAGYDYTSTDYSQVWKKVIFCIAAPVTVPLYRVALIFQHIFNLFKDLISDQFKGIEGLPDVSLPNRKWERLAFNLISIFGTGPLYVLLGVVEVICGVFLPFLLLLPTHTCFSANWKAIEFIELIDSMIHCSLVGYPALDFDNSHYLKDSTHLLTALNLV